MELRMDNLSEREKCIKKDNENNKNYEIYIENHPNPKRIEEKVKIIGSVNDFHDKLKEFDSQKEDNIDSDENNDTNNNLRQKQNQQKTL